MGSVCSCIRRQVGGEGKTGSERYAFVGKDFDGTLSSNGVVHPSEHNGHHHPVSAEQIKYIEDEDEAPDAGEDKKPEVKSTNVPTRIYWKDDSRSPAAEVFLVGGWDGWRGRYPLERSQPGANDLETEHAGVRMTYEAQLPRGRHEFKFVVDGRWLCSDLHDKCDNGMGDSNNYVVVA